MKMKKFINAPETITDEELQVLEDARDRRIAALRSQPMKKRLWQRYGQVLY